MLATFAPLATLATVVVAAAAPTPEQARQHAKEILGRTEFAEPPKSIPDRVLEWVSQRLADLFTNLAHGGRGSLVSWIVIAALAAIVGFVIYRVARTLRSDPTVRHEVIGPVSDRSSADWRAEAERFEAVGSWKAALRSRYRALVADLVIRDVVRAVPGRTTGEYRQEVARHAPAVAKDFAAASDLFEQAWYGDLGTGPEENTRFRSLSDQVIDGTRSPRTGDVDDRSDVLA